MHALLCCLLLYTTFTQKLHAFTQVRTERAVVGGVADLSIRDDNGSLVTVVHVLELNTGLFPLEPNLLQVRLCGDLSGIFGPAVHTNITLVYELQSQSRLTGCLRLIRTEPW